MLKSNSIFKIHESIFVGMRSLEGTLISTIIICLPNLQKLINPIQILNQDLVKMKVTQENRIYAMP